MMDVLKQTEGRPDHYLVTTAASGETDGTALSDALWQRIESYIAYRWHPRPVSWIICGAGDWTPPLTPATVETVEIWGDRAYHEIDAPVGPLGYDFRIGTYRVSATVGEAQDPPHAVRQAYERLHGYLTDQYVDMPVAVTKMTIGLGGTVSEDHTRPATWVARALQYSGAADLLRPYRRA